MKELSKKMYALAEAIADIAYIAGYHRYYPGDSRKATAEFIYWAQEFEEKNKGVEWGIDEGADYMDAIDAFAEEKIKLFKNKMATPVFIPYNTDFNMMILYLQAYRDTFDPWAIGYIETQKQIDQLKLIKMQYEAALQPTHI